MFKRIFFLILFLNISSCDSPKYLKFHDFNNGWAEAETLSFEFNVDFETKMADLSFILRHNNEYSFSNIFLITEFSANGNLIDKDTLEFKLANYRGEWLGNKKISVIEHMLPYKKGLIFDDSNYKLNIRTSMRSRNKVTEIERLDGIVNFGLLID